MTRIRAVRSLSVRARECACVCVRSRVRVRPCACAREAQPQAEAPPGHGGGRVHQRILCIDMEGRSGGLLGGVFGYEETPALFAGRGLWGLVWVLVGFTPLAGCIPYGWVCLG